MVRKDTTLRVSKKIAEQLKEIKKPKESYNKVLKKLLKGGKLKC